MRVYLPGELGSQRSNMGSPSHHRERRAAVQVGRTDPRYMAPLGPRPFEASFLSIKKKQNSLIMFTGGKLIKFKLYFIPCNY